MSSVFIFQHDPDVSAGSLVEIFKCAKIATQICRLFDHLPDFPPLEQASGLIFLGGPMSANDTVEHPFLAAELNWMRSAVEQEIPLLGICLGAQMLAKALGGRVYPHTVREIGWSEIDLLPAAQDDALFRGRNARETVFQWHGDTFDMPPGAVQLATGSQCRNQAYRVGKSAYGVQFHAEMTPEIMHKWLAEKPAKIIDRLSEPIDPAKIAAMAVDRFPAMNDYSQAILSRFAVLCAGGPTI